MQLEQATWAALLIFLAGHLFVTIWWASKVSTTITNFTEKFVEMCDEIKEIKSNMFTRKDADRELEIAEDAHKAIHRRIDRIEAKVS